MEEQKLPGLLLLDTSKITSDAPAKWRALLQPLLRYNEVDVSKKYARGESSLPLSMMEVKWNEIK